MLDFSIQSSSLSVHGHVQVVFRLESKPELRRSAKVTRQTQSGIGSDAASFERDLVDTAGINANLESQMVLAQSRGFKELLKQYFPRVNRM